MDMDQDSPEVMTAIQAAIKASVLCEKIRMDLSAGESRLKSDGACDHCRLRGSGDHL